MLNLPCFPDGCLVPAEDADDATGDAGNAEGEEAGGEEAVVGEAEPEQKPTGALAAAMRLERDANRVAYPFLHEPPPPPPEEEEGEGEGGGEGGEEEATDGQGGEGGD